MSEFSPSNDGGAAPLEPTFEQVRRIHELVHGILQDEPATATLSADFVDAPFVSAHVFAHGSATIAIGQPNADGLLASRA